MDEDLTVDMDAVEEVAPDVVDPNTFDTFRWGPGTDNTDGTVERLSTAEAEGSPPIVPVQLPKPNWQFEQ